MGRGADAMYNDIPVYDDRHDDVVWEGRRGSGLGEGVRRNRSGSLQEASGNPSDYVYNDKPKRVSTWADDIYDRNPSGGAARRTDNRFDDDYVYTDNRQPSAKKTGPGRPTSAKPIFKEKTGSLQSNQAVALFTFDADQPGDLGFKKGEIITVTKKTDSDNDWWTGIIGTRTGIFPSNYVEMKK